MKVLQVIASVSRVHGGPAAAMQVIVGALSRAGASVSVATTNDDGAATLDVPLETRTVFEGMPVTFFARTCRPYTVSVPLARWLDRHVADFDFVHCHGLFTHAPVAAALAARRHGVPYAVRTQGTLNSWGLSRRRPALKRLSRWLREDVALRGASFVHVTSDLEARELSQSLALPTIETVPIGFPFEPETVLDREAFRTRLASGPILFLGRFHPIKRIEMLIEAFASVRRAYPERRIVLAGAGDAAYTDTLRAHTVTHGIADAVDWPGFVEADTKQALLESSAVLVLPSDSENFGVSVVEAMAAGTPQVVRQGVALANAIRRFGSGVVSGDTSESLAEGILGILDDAGRAASMAEGGYRAMREQFSEARMAERLLALYRLGCDTGERRLNRTEA